MSTWDARAWLADLIGCPQGDLTVRSVDRYGPTETQVRYERGDEAVARLIVAGPIVQMGEPAGGGHWSVSVRIGSGSVIGAGSVVTRDVPERVFAAGNPCRVTREITE